MKKILSLLTGIGFLFIVLFATGCSTKTVATSPEDAPINIFCKAIETDDGSLQITMWDDNDALIATVSSDDPLKYVDTLVTEVGAGKIVFWNWGGNSQVHEFVNIAPPTPGKIIPEAAKPDDSRKRFILRIPKNAPIGEESYFIQFVWKGDTVTIDPHLKIPPE